MTKPTIVCVDDERIVLISLRDQLTNYLGSRYTIELAESGEEALEIFEELGAEGIEIPLIISDQIMPGMKGDELLIKIHAQYAKTLKILLTGQASADAVGNAVNAANLYRYIAKPWDEGDLCLTVTEALRSYAQDKQLAEQNEALQKINAQLAQLNVCLEEKVVERTAELAKAEAELRGIFAAMTEQIFVYDIRGCYLKIVSNTPAFLCQPSEILLGKTLYEIFEQEQADTFLGYIQKALETQQTVSTEYSLSIDGQNLWFAANISPISVDSVIWVARDITALRESEEKFASAFRSSPSAITITQFSNGYHIEVNDSFCEFTGYAREEILGRTAFDLNLWVNLDDRAQLFQALEEKGIVHNYEFDFRTKSGAIKTALLSAEVIELNGQTCVLSVSQDISDRKQIEAAMQQAKEAAEAANRAKSTFLANMSHELRSPLNAILGFSQLLTRSRSLTAEQQESVSIINRSGEHLLTLINNVLDLSKIEAGRTTLNETNFDLYRLLDDLEDMFQLKADDKGLQLIFDRACDVPQYIRTDQVKLRQVLINLLSNALKFTSEGGVTVTVERSLKLAEILNCDFYLLFSVCDTGIGLAPDECDRLFEAFVQTQTGRDSQEGTGLGLAISRKFVQLMGGDISVTSRVGQGTTFIFDIKVTPADAADITDEPLARRVFALQPNQPTYRILIVDDKWSNRQLLMRLLSPLGFELKEASNGKEAVELWQTFEPHLVWMDMRMPMMDGYEATKRIKSHLKGQATAIIALTASTLEEERAIVLSAGCDDFVRKPFREQVIFDKIAQYLGVRYVYEKLTSPASEAVKSDSSLRDVLAAMPRGWVNELYQAADSIDNERIFQLLKQIPPTHAFFRQTIADWVHSFRCDKIIDLIEDHTGV